MYLKKITINNYGCIGDFSYETAFNKSGFPKPIIFMGKNGSGKTLALINIFDSLIKLYSKKAAKNKDELNRGSYKKLKKAYIKSGKSYSYVHTCFEDNKQNIEYVELSAMSRNKFLNEIDNISKFYKFDKFDSEFIKTGYYKKIYDYTTNDWYKQNIFLYFPVHRYYNPSWYQKDDERVLLKTYDDDEIIYKDIIKDNVLKEMEQWILDLILDRYLYEARLKKTHITEIDNNGKLTHRDVIEHKGYDGKNNTTINLLNNILTIIYKKKFDDLEYARLGVSNKEKRRVSVLVKQKNQPEIQLAPTFSYLSSGEAMIFSIFGSILRSYDSLNTAVVKSLDEIKGIVVIDEVDMNLNYEFAKEILPELIAAFKGIQFIMTTHSPFFLLGMKDYFRSGLEIINMSTGLLFNNKECLTKIKECYDALSGDLNEKDKKKSYNAV